MYGDIWAEHTFQITGLRIIEPIPSVYFTCALRHAVILNSDYFKGFTNHFPKIICMICKNNLFHSGVKITPLSYILCSFFLFDDVFVCITGLLLKNNHLTYGHLF